MRVTLSCCLGEVHPYSGCCGETHHVATVYEANVVGIILEEDEQVKSKYLTVAMAISRTSGKSTYATWLSEGDGSKSGYVMKAILE